MITYIGFLMVAFFDGCDPVALGEVQTIDQLTIVMANRIFDGYPGLPGLFLATIFSATLSTASSGINSLTAVLWEDFLKEARIGKRLSDAATARLMKAMSVRALQIYLFCQFPIRRFSLACWPREWHLLVQIWVAFFTSCSQSSVPHLVQWWDFSSLAFSSPVPTNSVLSLALLCPRL